MSYAELIEFFYRTHDPTQLNQQGNDRGTQYRSAIFAHDQTQLDIAKKVTEEVQKKHFDPKGKKIVTQLEIRPKEDFFPADDLPPDVPDQQPQRLPLLDSSILVVSAVTARLKRSTTSQTHTSYSIDLNYDSVQSPCACVFSAPRHA